MKIEIMGIRPLSDYEKSYNLEKELEHNAKRAQGEDVGDFEPTYKERPDTLTIEDSNDKGMILIKAGDSYSTERVQISIEDLKRALKVF